MWHFMHVKNFANALGISSSFFSFGAVLLNLSDFLYWMMYSTSITAANSCDKYRETEIKPQ